MSDPLPGKLRREGGYGITHAVSLSRADASPFTADDATQALYAVRSALSLILGRRTDVVLEPRPAGLGAVGRWTGRYLPRARNVAGRQHRR